MANKKKTKSLAEKSAQARRTHRNKVKKYKKLISKFPSSFHAEIWRRKLAHSEARI